MVRVLLPALMALSLFLPTGATSSSGSTIQDPSATLALTGHEGGAAMGTVVVWDHFTTGRPTAHLQGKLYDCDGNQIAAIVARLEDWGGVTGYAMTRYGCVSLDGGWCFDRRHEEGRFELEFDYGRRREVALQGCFDGMRARWATEWELEH